MSTLERVVEGLRDLPEESLERVASFVHVLRLTQEETRLNRALRLFAAEEVTLGQAAEIAQMNHADFLRELGKRRIPIHYGVEEFRQDLETLAQVGG